MCELAQPFGSSRWGNSLTTSGVARQRRYCRSTVKRLMEYPSAPPTKSSDKKWADRESLENPTAAANPYAMYGTQR
jgi:hypothetical protein